MVLIQGCEELAGVCGIEWEVWLVSAFDCEEREEEERPRHRDAATGTLTHSLAHTHV